MTDKKQIRETGVTDSDKEESVDLTIRIPEDLYRAYQRGCLIINRESGRDRNELAREMVTDFLKKYGC